MAATVNAQTTTSPWSLSEALEERERAITASGYQTEASMAAEREERWHAARLFRRRFKRPESWLDCAGLSDVPVDPVGWCTCGPEAGGS